MPSSFIFAKACYLGVVVSAGIWRLTTFNFTASTISSFSIVLAAWALYQSWIYPFYVSPLRHIPTVPGFPLWGQTYERFTSEVGKPEREWHNKYGLIVRFFLPFGAERLSIADDGALREVLVHDSYNFIRPKRVIRWMGPILGDQGILLANGELHAKQRRALAPAFSPASIRRLEPEFWNQGLLLTHALQRLIGDSNDSQEQGKAVEILDWMQRATLDLIGSAGCGYDVNSLENPDVPLRKLFSSIFALDMRSCIVQTLRLYMDMAKFIPCEINKAMKLASSIANSTASEIMGDKLRNKIPKTQSDDTISQLITQNENLGEDHPHHLQEKAVHDDIMTLFGAGHDTTAAALAWTIDLLSKHPDIQSRLRTEILERMPKIQGRSINFSTMGGINVDNLPYLNKVCRESLRYIPPIPTVSRQSVRHTQLAGYFVPGGTSIHISANAINHLPCYWGDDAERFDPDRWDHLPGNWTPNAYQSFLSGPRGCIGRKFAETEIKVFLCCLLAKFEFEREEGVVDQETCKMWRLVLRPRDGLFLRLKTID